MRTARATLVLIALALGSCASPGPRPKSSAPVPADALEGVTKVAQTPPLEREWWHAFGDSALDGLVSEALAASPTLAAARAHLASARAVAEGASAARGPVVTLDAQLPRTRYSETGLFPPPIAGSTFNDARLAADLSWDLDPWHRARLTADRESLRAGAAEVDSAASELLVASSVVKTYVQLDHAYRALDTARASRKSRADLLDLTRQRAGAGLDTEVEVETARGALAQADAEVTGANEQRRLLEYQIVALCGQGPGAATHLARPVLKDAALAPPETLPADLVARRPDVAALLLEVEAASTGVRAARAAFYPNLNLAAFIGFESVNPGHLLEGGNYIWSVGPALSLPIFDSGRLRAGLHGADADYESAVALYNQGVLNAFREVAQEVASLQALEAEQTANRAALTSLSRAFDLALLRYKSGLANYLTVLIAQDRLLAQERVVVDAEARRAELTVDLFRALGGGYRNPANSGARGDS